MRKALERVDGDDELEPGEWAALLSFYAVVAFACLALRACLMLLGFPSWVWMIAALSVVMLSVVWLHT